MNNPKPTWKCTYKGARDLFCSASGHAAPSWSSFDYREWAWGDYTVTLLNLRNSKELFPYRLVRLLDLTPRRNDR